MPKRALVAGLVTVFCAAAVGAQRPAFDVASVKPNASGTSAGWTELRPGGELSVRNQPLRNIIWSAYDLQAFQLVGGPDWLDRERFDIVAKPAAEPPSREALLQMVQSLLAERFKLVAHRETRDAPIYALVTARAGTPGPGMRPSPTDCDAINAAAGRGAPPPGNAGLRPLCGVRTTPGRLMAGGVRMETLARNLSALAGRIVVDRTALPGFYDVDLEWLPDQVPAAGGALPPAASDAPGFFTAIQEQLGLKLEAQRGPIDVMVIDSVERPTPD